MWLRPFLESDVIYARMSIFVVDHLNGCIFPFPGVVKPVHRGDHRLGDEGAPPAE